MWNFLKSQAHRNRVEWWLPETGDGENRKILVKGYKLRIVRGISSGDVSIVSIATHLWHHLDL